MPKCEACTTSRFKKGIFLKIKSYASQTQDLCNFFMICIPFWPFWNGRLYFLNLFHFLNVVKIKIMLVLKIAGLHKWQCNFNMEMQYNITSLLRCYKEIVFFFREKIIFLGFIFHTYMYVQMNFFHLRLLTH